MKRPWFYDGQASEEEPCDEDFLHAPFATGSKAVCDEEPCDSDFEEPLNAESVCDLSENTGPAGSASDATENSDSYEEGCFAVSPPGNLKAHMAVQHVDRHQP